MSDEKVRENRLRRMAGRQGLLLRKSRRRDPHALDYQRYALVSENEFKIVGGWGPGGRFGFTLDEAEEFLSRGTRRQP